MKEQMKELLSQSTKLELNVAEVYEIFANTFSEDRNFWWSLVIEEKNHAAILRSGENSYLKINLFPEAMLSDSLDSLKMINKNLQQLISEFNNKKPSRELAFNIAYKLEQTAGEIHFQDYMTKKSESEVDRILQRLNQDDKDHADRIMKYMKEHEISINEDILPGFLRQGK